VMDIECERRVRPRVSREVENKRNQWVTLRFRPWARSFADRDLVPGT